MHVRPLHDRVLVRRIEAEEKTAGGIIIALVCFVAYNFFASRRNRTIAVTEQAATKLINALEARGTFVAGGQVLTNGTRARRQSNGRNNPPPMKESKDNK